MRVELELPDDLTEALERFMAEEPLPIAPDVAVLLLLREMLETLGLLEVQETPEDPGELH